LPRLGRAKRFRVPCSPPGKKVQVRNAPTFFGEVSCTIKTDGNGKKGAVPLDPPRPAKPGAIRIFLRYPGKIPIRSCTASGAASSDFTAEAVTPGECDKHGAVEVRYRKP